MKRDIFVVTAAYGHDGVLALGGQQKVLPFIAASGASGVEIRRELFNETHLKCLPDLHQAIRGYGLRCYYSAPEALFAPNGAVNPRLSLLLDEAEQLGAERLKLSLGHYMPGHAVSPSPRLPGGYHPQLLVENDQTECGALAPLKTFFAQAAADKTPIGMTFDMGNWQWVGESAVLAAQQLAPYIRYIHIKTALPTPTGWRAVPPGAGDEDWRHLLSLLPDNVPRGIEFPLYGEDLAAVTKEFVQLLH
ncbi:sugar phosphate isomerase/epimerase family protein [Martelella alba]|uniref:Sugar phosphate isomerase/epimerase n=1 Tax=Martelella alba TaxID=2590451 RepID=A0ABY2SN74_9HYPH|nr:sugar phosphate isomerase/epimerase [Martelella alba]TKI07272.1 sugar phosphate isomerase/epimerase [Martelella alba]